MPLPVLTVEKESGIATLTLNRPQARNALSAELRTALRDAFHSLPEDDEVGVVILTGAAPAFCAGLDLAELSSTGMRGAGVAAGQSVVDAMEACDRPIIGAINGAAITGGFEVALACDVLIGSTQARFADTHARVGILPGWGLSQKLPRLIGPLRAKWASLTGNFIDATLAERWGLLAQVVAQDALLPTCRQLAQDMLSCVPEALRAYKRLIDAGYAIPYGEGRQLETRESRKQVAGVSADDIASRRQGIQTRGREQAGG